MLTFTKYLTPEALDLRLSQEICGKINSAISQKGYASLVVSGGRTPAGLFALLSQQPLEWDKVFITLADERWVDPNDDASNEKSVRQNLLQGYAAKAKFLGLKTPKDNPFEGAKDTEALLKNLPQPFDAVILGMGEDGHTASLFPGATNLPLALDKQSPHLCLGITPLTAPYDRITLTLPTLLNSQVICLHIVGDNKKAVYEQAKSGQDVNEMPIRAFLHQNKVPVVVYWAA